MTTTPTLREEQIRERFHKRFLTVENHTDVNSFTGFSIEDILDFIYSETKQAVEEERERILQYVRSDEGEEFKYLLADVREFAKQIRELIIKGE